MVESENRKIKIMKIIKYTIAAVTFLGITANMSAKEEKAPKTYMFGFAASFNDSTVYFTDIQEITDAYMAEKTKFLVNRDEYSYQFRNYLQGEGKQYPTCITSYAYNRKDIVKKYEKLRKKYMDNKNKGRYIIVNIDSKQFTYKPVSPDEEIIVEDAGNNAKKGKMKKGKAPDERHKMGNQRDMPTKR